MLSNNKGLLYNPKVLMNIFCLCVVCVCVCPSDDPNNRNRHNKINVLFLTTRAHDKITLAVVSFVGSRQFVLSPGAQR
nr:Caab101 [Calliteara abietis nucleopolyhedrovirus]